jgi:aminoglycoside phosphotransferase (APT) family kinase protein
MKSKTQKPITRNELVKILKYHFGDNVNIGEIKELAEGWYSVAYSVELPDLHFNVIIKLQVPKESRCQIYEFKALETEIKVMELISHHPIGTEIPLPKLIGYDLDGNLIGRGYFITKKFAGIPLDKLAKKIPKSEMATIEFQIGQLQAKINTIKGEKFGYFIDHPDYPTHSDTWGYSFTQMMKNLFRDADNYKLNLPYDRDLISSFLKKAEKVLNLVEKPSLVHWDLWLGNIFIIQEKNSWTLEGIIDFERAIWGDPLTESSLRGKKKKFNLIKGYGVDLFGSEEQKIRDAFYDIYLGTTLFVECYVREYSRPIRLLYKILAGTYLKSALKYLKTIYK